MGTGESIMTTGAHKFAYTKDIQVTTAVNFMATVLSE
jgi:hypothetical protein